MSDVADKLSLLINTKTDIMNAISEKGQIISEATPFSEYAEKIRAISGGKRVCRFVIGTSTNGWTTADCDYLCDGTDDQIEILQAITDLPSNGGEIILLDGTYNISATLDLNYIEKTGVVIKGNGYSTKINLNKNAITLMATDDEQYETHPYWKISIENLEIDSGAITISFTNISISKCKIYNIKTDIIINSSNNDNVSINISDNLFSCDSTMTLQGEVDSLIYINSLNYKDKAHLSINKNTFVSDTISNIRAISSNSGGKGTISDNTFIDFKYPMQIDYANVIGNIFYNTGISSGFGGSIIGNTLYNGSIRGNCEVFTSDEKPSTVINGNTIYEGSISATGPVIISNNTIYSTSTSVSCIATDMGGANNTVRTLAPLITGNMCKGGPYGIRLLPGISGRTYQNVVVSNNVCYNQSVSIMIATGWNNCLISNNMIQGNISDSGTENAKINNITVKT